ncbi:putative carnitine O-acetyltransferase mitochondrial precursor [Jaminaea rosea]|uniref:Carnitine O-acetyltransferase, mitochondrial n=1 Tax=Jaminaea rosea TaxID=1569628 RepID=A0A316UT12_9BASI|nr:putative carnitine O-acetyltransferase mitochondrial precursor [Jaminaea rosea]PWN27023.1 putative carnitine O-acetyltransferase mitochondrial precursor [Jaminaea rosea]
MILKASTLANGKGKLFEGQQSLPSLPVPALEQTLKKYLRSTVPHQANEQALEKTQAAVESALSGKDHELFMTLQKRLQERAASPESDGNWLASWWNTAAYMSYRDPVVPYVSYFYAHKDDKLRTTAPKRASALLKGVLAFRKLVESEELAPEKTKTGYLCSGSYPWMFNASRIPVKGEDEAVKYPADKNNHVVVVRKGRFYEFDLVDGSGKELSAADIEAQLDKILAQASEPESTPVGALTSDNRDKWLSSRETLMSASPKNKEALERIQSAVIVLCLDDLKPVTREDSAWQLWYGDGKNRFYDKQQLIVFDNGKSGYMGEHSTMDGTPTLRMNDFIIQAIAANKIDMGASEPQGNLGTPKPIGFELDAKSKDAVKQSISNFEALKAKHDLSILDFQGYGKNAIKAYKCSPDAWVQMVIQLAFFKKHGHPAPTYESAQTRKFKWGRTETIRSCSPESQAFVEAMQDPVGRDEDRYAKFQAAVKQHLNYATSAADGQGVDRHLFGLKKLLKDGEEVPALYKDEAFGKSSNWQLSTSQISSEVFSSWGYGEVVPDGYGCAYAIKGDSLTFTVTSLKLGAGELTHYLNEAALELREMHDRLAKAREAESGKGKL